MTNKILVVIPCRAGSKRFPGKNMAPIRGMPLAMNTCVIALDTFGQHVDIVVSSDDDSVLDMCVANNISIYERIPELATDDATSEDVVMDVLNHYQYLNEFNDQYEHVILMQVTSPLLDPGRLATAMDQYLEQDLPSMVAVNPAYQPCGAFYIVKTELFRANPSWYQPKGGIFILPWDQCLDVDYEYTLDICQAIAYGRTFGTQICGCNI